MQPDGRGAGATIEGEGDRTLFLLFDAVTGVSDKENFGFGLVPFRLALFLGFFLEDDGARGDGVVDFTAVYRHHMMGFNQVVFRFWLFFCVLFFFVLFGLVSHFSRSLVAVSK